MGGRPLASLNLVCWPRELPGELLGEVLAGGKGKGVRNEWHCQNNVCAQIGLCVTEVCF
jgi:hypothetical protein